MCFHRVGVRMGLRTVKSNTVLGTTVGVCQHVVSATQDSYPLIDFPTADMQ